MRECQIDVSQIDGTVVREILIVDLDNDWGKISSRNHFRHTNT